MISKKEFKEMVWKIVEEINAKPTQIRIRAMKSKVGSCSSKKIITFNTSVLSLEKNFQREVILHELLHLRYKNHGKLFKAVLKTYLNNMK